MPGDEICLWKWDYCFFVFSVGRVNFVWFFSSFAIFYVLSSFTCLVSRSHFYVGRVFNYCLLNINFIWSAFRGFSLLASNCSVRRKNKTQFPSGRESDRTPLESKVIDNSSDTRKHKMTRSTYKLFDANDQMPTTTFGDIRFLAWSKIFYNSQEAERIERKERKKVFFFVFDIKEKERLRSMEPNVKKTNWGKNVTRHLLNAWPNRIHHSQTVSHFIQFTRQTQEHTYRHTNECWKWNRSPFVF